MDLRRVHTMKVMRIGSELIRIVCVHTECALTAICTECAFGQSTFISGLKANRTITGINVGVIYSRMIGCVGKHAIWKETTNITLLFRSGKVLYL